MNPSHQTPANYVLIASQAVSARVRERARSRARLKLKQEQGQEQEQERKQKEKQKKEQECSFLLSFFNTAQKNRHVFVDRLKHNITLTARESPSLPDWTKPAFILSVTEFPQTIWTHVLLKRLIPYNALFRARKVQSHCL